MKNLILILTSIFSLNAFAVDSEWLGNRDAYSCWKALGDRKLNPSPMEAGYYTDGFTYVETSFERGMLVTIRSSSGTINVSKNGSCTRSEETSEQFIAKKLGEMADKHASFKLNGSGYKLDIAPNAKGQNGGSEFLPANAYLGQKENLKQIFRSCAKASGSIGESARAALAKVGANKSDITPPNAVINR